MRNKNQEENWEKELAQFLLSEEILFENEIGEGWIKISEGKQLTGEYQKIINKVAQILIQEKTKNRQKFIETIEDVCKGLPSIQRQLKEAIKDEK